jgi:Flp pilus assembly protein TadD/4-amino-4-deoxy-L-arabinose transferase-like glycosyltransferase
VRRYRLFLLLAAVFAAKLIVLLQLRDHPLLQPDTGLDTAVYTRLALEVASGNTWLGPGLYFVSPLYIYFLALAYAIGKTMATARVIQIVLGTAAVGSVFVAARAWFGERAAWVAAIAAGLTGLFTFHEVLLLQAALDPFLTAAALACLALAFARRPMPWSRLPQGTRAASHGWFGAAGLIFGVQALNRPNVLIPALVVVGMLAAARRATASLAMAAGLVLALAPLAVRNYAIAGDWSPVSSHGGLNFYIGNNAEANGAYAPVPGITADVSGQQNDARRVAEQAAGRRLDDGEVSAYFYDLGWTWIRLNPGAAIRLFLRKLAYTFNAGYISLNYSYPFYAHDQRTLLAWMFVGPWLLLPLGLAGLLSGVARERRTDYLIWLSFVPVYALSVAVFFVSERYRLPLLVPLCVGAGAAVDSLALSAREPARAWKRGTLLTGVLVVFAIALAANWPMHADDGRAEERTRMAEAMIVHDDIAAAEMWTAKAEAIHPRPAIVHFRVGRLLIVHSRPDAALAHLQRALQLEPGEPGVEYAIGQALVDARRPAEAIPHLRAALQGGSRVNLAGYDLARALAATGDRAGALQVLQGVRPENASDAQAWQALGQLALQLQSPSLAAAFFNQAIVASPRSAKPRQDLGLALAMMGRSADAIAQFEQAVSLDVSDPAAHLNLAVAYAEAGRKVDARAQAEEALRLNPGYQRARQVLGMLR